MSGNGQQYSDDITLHYRDAQNTYEFYQPFYVEDILPNSAKSTGHTDIHLTGMGFDQFKNNNGTSKDVSYKCRFKDTQGNIIIEERNMTRVSDIEYICPTSPTNYTGSAAIEINQNDRNWQDIGRNVELESGAKVNAVDPVFGVTKNPHQSKVKLIGENFVCPPGGCTHLKVRFTTKNGDRIVVNGEHESDTVVHAEYPQYPSPETLTIDISMNGIDWSGDKVKFSYIDPFVLGVKPRLISPRGTTTLTIEGYGMAQTGVDDMQQVSFMHYHDNVVLESGNKPALKIYKAISEEQVEVKSYPQSDLYYNG